MATVLEPIVNLSEVFPDFKRDAAAYNPRKFIGTTPGDLIGEGFQALSTAQSKGGNTLKVNLPTGILIFPLSGTTRLFRSEEYATVLVCTPSPDPAHGSRITSFTYGQLRRKSG